MAWNDWLFHKINEGPEALAPTMHFFSEAITYPWMRIVLGLIVIGMLWRGPRSRTAAIQALLAVALANGFTDLFKVLHPEPRPYQQLATALLHTPGHVASGMMVVGSTNFGTASAHSANMAAVALIFCLELRWWGTPWVLVAVLTGWSRIYLAAHYPYQVLLGYGCGCVAALLITWSWDLGARRQAHKRRRLEAGQTE